MSEPDEIPEGATSLPPSEYTDVQESTEELSPTKGIPDDIEIPLENQTGGLITPTLESSSGETTPDNIIYKSIWPPLIMAFAMGCTVGTLILLTPLGSKGSNLIHQIQNQVLPDERPAPVSEPGNTQLTINKGFGSGGSSMAREMAINRIGSAEKNIVWITNFPNDPAILQALDQKKGTPTLIIIGGDARKSNAEPAQNMGLGIIRASQTLEDTEGYLVIDNNYIIDIGRDQTIWETVDPYVNDQINQWIDSLLKNAKPL